MYHQREYVTVQPDDSDPWILHMQRHVVIERPYGGGQAAHRYMVRLENVTPDNAIQGPIPESRLLPGWVEQDGRVRVDIYGHKVLPGEHSAEDGYPGRWCGAGHCAGVRR